MLGLSVQHDANHGALSSSSSLNSVFGFIDDMIGGSSLLWRHQHNAAHHVHTNHHQLDCDTFSNHPLIRFHPALPLCWAHRLQHVYAPLLYPALGIAYFVGDVGGYVRRRYEYVRLHSISWSDSITFWSGKAAHLAVLLLLPAWFHGFWRALLTLYLPLQLGGGLTLAALFSVSHNVPACLYDAPPSMSWAEAQIRSSANWSVFGGDDDTPRAAAGASALARLAAAMQRTGNRAMCWFWLLFSGGLNYQIEHHLFPGVSHLHYPAISRIVRGACKERNIPYNAYGSYAQILRAHVEMLYALGHYADPRQHFAASASAQSKSASPAPCALLAGASECAAAADDLSKSGKGV
jgi:linoleoyl-CoA desaturase